VLNAMKGFMNENLFAVGPLVLESTTVNGVEEVSMPGIGSGLLEEDPVSLSWLDGQKPNSVLFVSFGSIVTASMEQMREFAFGLEASNTAFLWVIRPDLIDDTSQSKECQTMFAELVKRTQNRALLVPWAPQTAVLSHPAVGAFLTHCGWNSTLESISSGVPMLGWPRFADQNTNSHYVTSVWKVGLELRQSTAEDGSAVVLKDEIADKVKKIMGDSETEDLEVSEIRRNARNLQMAARNAVSNGGSSQAALSQFVKLITSLRTKDGSKS